MAGLVPAIHVFAQRPAGLALGMPGYPERVRASPGMTACGSGRSERPRAGPTTCKRTSETGHQPGPWCDARRPVSVPGSRHGTRGRRHPHLSPALSAALYYPSSAGRSLRSLGFRALRRSGAERENRAGATCVPPPPSGEGDRGRWARRLRYSLLSAGPYLYDARTTPCDARVTLQACATRACGTLDSAPATFQARATSHLSHLILLNPGESHLELNVYPSRRVLRPAPGGANARAPRRESRPNRGRRCPPRASPRDRAGRGRAGRRSKPERVRPALRGRAWRRASP